MTSHPAADPALARQAPPLRDMARARHEGLWLMTAGGVLLGTVGIFIEEAGQPPATAVWCRCVFGMVALLAWAAARGRLHEITGLRGRPAVAVAAAGALTIASWGLFFAAIPRCSIAVATVVFHLQPIWLLVLGPRPARPGAARALWWATVVALVGLVLASGVADHGAAWWADREGYALGLGLSLAGSLVYAGATLVGRYGAQRAGSLAQAVGPCAVGTVALSAWPVLHGLPAWGPVWGWLAGLGVLHTGLAYVVLFAGMARLETGRVAVLQFVYPATAVLVDWAVYGRALSPLQMAGVLMIGGALWRARRIGE